MIHQYDNDSKRQIYFLYSFFEIWLTRFSRGGRQCKQSPHCSAPSTTLYMNIMCSCSPTATRSSHCSPTITIAHLCCCNYSLRFPFLPLHGTILPYTVPYWFPLTCGRGLNHHRGDPGNQTLSVLLPYLLSTDIKSEIMRHSLRRSPTTLCSCFPDPTKPPL